MKEVHMRIAGRKGNMHNVVINALEIVVSYDEPVAFWGAKGAFVKESLSQTSKGHVRKAFGVVNYVELTEKEFNRRLKAAIKVAL